MNEHYLSNLLELRLLVGFLGERSQFGWWPTSFHQGSSRHFLEPVFAKTSRLAQYHGVVEAARRIHDDHLNVGSYHLFRLPEEIEQDLHALVLSPVGEKLAGKLPATAEEAIALLRTNSSDNARFGEGPIAVGSIKDIESLDLRRTIASAYLSAFSGSARVYPYLMG